MIRFVCQEKINKKINIPRFIKTRDMKQYKNHYLIGRNQLTNYELTLTLIKRIEVSFSIVIIFMFYPLHKFNHGTSNRC